MGVIIITQEEVPRLLPMEECVEVMAQTLKTLAQGDAILPLRSLIRLPDQSGLLGVMPGYLGGPPVMGIKVVSVMPGNHGTEFDAHQGVVLIFETEHGRLLAIIDASSITAIRTAAVSGVSTRALARAEAGDLAILGSGVQAESHLDAMRAVRRLRRVRVWSRNHSSAERFAAQQSERLGFEIEPIRSTERAVEGADLICTTTASREPVLMGDWIAPGAHINAVGACFPAARELDTAAMRRARLYVDRRESALNEAGDFLIPKREGAFGDEHIVGEIGEVLLGKVAGRRAADEVTLFKSLGLAVEDLAAARHIYHQAEATSSGRVVEMGGRRVAHA